MDRKSLLLGILALVIIVVILSVSRKAPSQNWFLTNKDICDEFQNYPSNTCWSHLGDFPKVLGNYSKNGLGVKAICFCSDVCPAYARLEIVYMNIKSYAECAKVGGIDLIDPAWHGYIGCAPLNYTDECKK